ncbi:MAG: transglycosylase [Planctomycetota bacterium]|nr:MAG: transglycosylase [Planctomycetota bacterium]
MDGNEFMPEVARQWANDVLVWIGFGTLAGLLAKAIMPGRDPGGAVATLAMGIGGVVIGCGSVTYFLDGPRVTPISPIGFLTATAGAFVLLFFYRLLSGRFFREGERTGAPHIRRYARRAPTRAAHYED